MKKTIYYASYLTNTHTYKMFPYEFTNKRKAIRAIRELANSGDAIGGYVTAMVWTDNPLEPFCINIIRCSK